MIDWSINRLIESIRPILDFHNARLPSTNAHELFRKAILFGNESSYKFFYDNYEDIANTSYPNDATYISPLHAAIATGNTDLSTKLLKNKRPYIIYHAAPGKRHDLLNIAIDMRDELTAIAIFEYGISNNKIEDMASMIVDQGSSKLTDDIDDMACMIAGIGQDTRRLTEITPYLAHAVNRNMPNLAKRILEELPKEEQNEQFLFDCLHVALGRDYLNVAKMFMLELPYNMVLKFIQKNIKTIPDQFISNFFTDRIKNIDDRIAFIEFLMRNNKINAAKELMLTLEPNLVLEFIQQHIKIIPDEFINLLFGDYFSPRSGPSSLLRFYDDDTTKKLFEYFNKALCPKAFFELLMRNNKTDAAMKLFDYLKVSEPQLTALINGNVPLSEKLLEKAIERNMRGAVRLLINKGCPGREHALERCIHHSLENLACELIHDGHGFHLHTLWVQAFKKSQFHVLKSMIRHGLNLNTISSLNWNKVQPNDNILIASLRYGKWDLMIEILKRKPPINYVQEAFDSVKLNYQANDPALNELIEAIKSLSQDEDMTPYLEIILSAINETSPEAVCFVGNVLYDAHLPQLAYPLLKDVPFSEKMREQYQKAQSACAHIVLNNCEQNESRENKERRIDATVEHLLEAKDKDLIKFLFKDLYKHQKQAEAQAQAPMPAPAQGSKQGSKPGSGG